MNVLSIMLAAAVTTAQMSSLRDSSTVVTGVDAGAFLASSNNTYSAGRTNLLFSGGTVRSSGTVFLVDGGGVAFRDGASLALSGPVLVATNLMADSTAPGWESLDQRMDRRLVGLFYYDTDRYGARSAITLGARRPGHLVGEGSLSVGSPAAASGRHSVAVGANSVASGESALASGAAVGASGNFSAAFGVAASASNAYSFVWSGRDVPAGYGSHGSGTFSIFPHDGVDGFWIGEQTLAGYVASRTSGFVDATRPFTYRSSLLDPGIQFSTAAGNNRQVFTDGTALVMQNGSRIVVSSNATLAVARPWDLTIGGEAFDDWVSARIASAMSPVNIIADDVAAVVTNEVFLGYDDWTFSSDGFTMSWEYGEDSAFGETVWHWVARRGGYGFNIGVDPDLHGEQTNMNAVALEFYDDFNGQYVVATRPPITRNALGLARMSDLPALTNGLSVAGGMTTNDVCGIVTNEIVSYVGTVDFEDHDSWGGGTIAVPFTITDLSWSGRTVSYTCNGAHYSLTVPPDEELEWGDNMVTLARYDHNGEFSVVAYELRIYQSGLGVGSTPDQWSMFTWDDYNWNTTEYGDSPFARRSRNALDLAFQKDLSILTNGVPGLVAATVTQEVVDSEGWEYEGLPEGAIVYYPPEQVDWGEDTWILTAYVGDVAYEGSATGDGNAVTLDFMLANIEDPEAASISVRARLVRKTHNALGLARVSDLQLEPVYGGDGRAVNPTVGYVLAGQTNRTVVASTALAGRVFDFSTSAGLYLAVSNIVEILGGSVTNFPASP